MNIMATSERRKRHPSEERTLIVVADHMHSAEATNDREKIVQIVQTLANKAKQALVDDRIQYDRFSRKLELSNKTHSGRQVLEIRLPYDSLSWNELDEIDIQLEILKRVVDTDFRWWESQLTFTGFIPGSTMRYINQTVEKDDCVPAQETNEQACDKKLKPTRESPTPSSQSSTRQPGPTAGHSKKLLGTPPSPQPQIPPPSRINPRVQIKSPLKNLSSILKERSPRDEKNSTPQVSLRQQHLLRLSRIDQQQLPHIKAKSTQAPAEHKQNYLMARPKPSFSSTKIHHNTGSQPIDITGDGDDDDDDDDIQIICEKIGTKKRACPERQGK